MSMIQTYLQPYRPILLRILLVRNSPWETILLAETLFNKYCPRGEVIHYRSSIYWQQIGGAWYVKTGVQILQHEVNKCILINNSVHLSLLNYPYNLEWHGIAGIQSFFS